MTACVEEKFALARKLAHNDKSVRDEALSLVKQWLDRRKTLTEQDYLKLWKALYYCMWMSDKPVIQHELAQNIAGIVLALSPDRAACFLKAFFQTMTREWAGTDHLRLDKFLALIRKMLTSLLKYMLSKDYIEQTSVHDSFIDVLKSAIFVKNKKDTRGIAMHIADVFVDELEAALEGVPQDHDEDAFRLVGSLIKLTISVISTKGLDKILFKRLHAAILERIVLDAEAVATAADEDDVQMTNLTTLVMMNAADLAKMAFDAASDPEAADRCRAPLYGLRKRFIGLQAQVEDALMEDSSDGNDSDGEPTPSLVGQDDIASESVDGGRADCPGACSNATSAEPTRDRVAAGDMPSSPNATDIGTAEELNADPVACTDVAVDCVAEAETPGNVASNDDAIGNVSNENAAMEEESPEPTLEVNEEQKPAADAREIEPRRRHRRRKQPHADTTPSEVISELPLVKRPKSDDAGGPVALPTSQSGDVVAGEETKTPPPPHTKSVHFSATKSVRRFNKRAPMKVAMPSRELISKKPQCSALKSRH